MPDNKLWLNFRDALQRLLKHPDLTPAQREFIYHNLDELDEKAELMDDWDIHHPRVDNE